MALSLFTAGAKLRASVLNALVNQINSLTAPGWVTYGTSTTILTASTTFKIPVGETYSYP